MTDGVSIVQTSEPLTCWLKVRYTDNFKKKFAISCCIRPVSFLYVLMTTRSCAISSLTVVNVIVNIKLNILERLESVHLCDD